MVLAPRGHAVEGPLCEAVHGEQVGVEEDAQTVVTRSLGLEGAAGHVAPFDVDAPRVPGGRVALHDLAPAARELGPLAVAQQVAVDVHASVAGVHRDRVERVAS